MTTINKPQSAPTILHSTAEIGLSGDSFNLKVTAFEVSVNSPLVDATIRFKMAMENLSMKYDRKQAGVMVQLTGRINGMFTLQSKSGGDHNSILEDIA